MKTIIFIFTVILLTVSITSCKEGEEGTSSPGTPGEREQALNDYKDLYLASAINSSIAQWSGNTANCNEGTLNPEVYTRVVNQVKYFRKICGLPYETITNDVATNPKCQKAALMCHANGMLSHTPPSNWSCYSADGAQGAQSSNLANSFTDIGDAIMQWIRDAGSSNVDVGHRRWILAARTSKIGYGATNLYAALWPVDNPFGPLPANAPASYSYPSKYIPAPLVFPRWSFSVPGKTTNSVDFSAATVTMTNATNQAVQLNIVARNGGYGDKTLIWEPTGIVTNSASDIKYTVKVNNVTVDGVAKNYTYTVTIFKP